MNIVGNNKRKIGVIPKKWRYLINAPFKISDECCNVCKKRPLNKYKKESGNVYLIGTLAVESNLRERVYLKSGCSIIEEGKEKCTPLAFWTEKDIKDYIKKYDISISKIYNLGYSRSGCYWCLYGIQYDKEPNRMQRMKSTHPAMWNHLVKDLKYDIVCNWIGVPWNITYNQECLDVKYE